MNTNQIDAEQLLNRLIDAHNSERTLGQKVAFAMAEISAWMPRDDVYSYEEGEKQALEAMAITVIAAPFASELYNYGWQELRDTLERIWLESMGGI